MVGANDVDVDGVPAPLPWRSPPSLVTTQVDEDGSEEEWSPRKGSPDKEKGAQGPPREQDPNELLAMIAQACMRPQPGCIPLQPGCLRS